MSEPERIHWLNRSWRYSTKDQYAVSSLVYLLSIRILLLLLKDEGNAFITAPPHCSDSDEYSVGPHEAKTPSAVRRVLLRYLSVY